MQTDAVLCAAAARGNALAFNELYRRHHPALRAFVFHLLGARHRREDAEDVVQEAFVRAFDAISGDRFHGDFKRWLFTIARNRSIDLLRGERVRLMSLRSAQIEFAPRALAGDASPAVVAETREEVAWLVAAIGRLPQRQRSALLLRELAGLSHEEIADELGTTRGSARQLITRARDRVRSDSERDGREREPQRSRSLRDELLETVPTLPLAAAGFAVSAGSSVGGALAVGKLAATIIAALVIAGAAGTVNHEVADASGAPASAVSTRPSDAADSSAVRTPSARSPKPAEAGTRSTLSGRDLHKERPHARPHGSTPQGYGTEGTNNAADPTKSAGTEAPVKLSESPVPVDKVVELPGNVVEHVTDGMNGTSSPDQAVGDVVGDVTDTLDGVTSGLLGG